MILIIGGAYQGRLDFARERFGLSRGDIALCSDYSDQVDWSRRCVAYLDRFALNRMRSGEDPVDIVRAHLDALESAVVVATDVSCGVVPIDPTLRAWREANGRINNLLASRAEEVWRLFCGLPQRLK